VNNLYVSAAAFFSIAKAFFSSEKGFQRSNFTSAGPVFGISVYALNGGITNSMLFMIYQKKYKFLSRHPWYKYHPNRWKVKGVAV